MIFADFLTTCALMVGVGTLFGILFNFLKGEPFRRCLYNIRLGVLGTSVGAVIGMNLPVFPEAREHVVVAFMILAPFYFFIGHWMISRGTTPVRWQLDNYRQPRMLDAHEVEIRTNTFNTNNRPAA